MPPYDERNLRRGPHRSGALLASLLCGFLAAAEGLRAQTPADATDAGSADRTGLPAAGPPTSDRDSHAGGDLFGLRPWLAARGMSLEALILGDLSRNFRGGVSTGKEVFRHLLEVSFTLETEPLFGVEGGTFFADFQTQDGRHGTENLVGDFQGFSNIDAPGFTALYELWYEQVFLGGRLRLKLGKIDANNEFAFVEHGGPLINSSAGFSPTMLGLTTYPNPATGVVLFASPVEDLYVGGGLFDGATQAGRPTGTRGPSTLFGAPSDLFLVAEAGRRTTTAAGRLRRVGLGVTHHTGDFDLVDGSGRTEAGATSYYLVLDQHLERQADAALASRRTIDGFLQLGYTDDRLSPVDLHAGAGVVWNGFLSGRDADSFGFMGTYVRFGEAARAAGAFVDSYELAWELFYRLELTAWLYLKPDLQYIVQPGGAGRADAFVGTLRVELTL
jgi:porin